MVNYRIITRKNETVLNIAVGENEDCTKYKLSVEFVMSGDSVHVTQIRVSRNEYENVYLTRINKNIEHVLSYLYVVFLCNIKLDQILVETQSMFNNYSEEDSIVNEFYGWLSRRTGLELYFIESNYNKRIDLTVIQTKDVKTTITGDNLMDKYPPSVYVEDKNEKTSQ